MTQPIMDGPDPRPGIALPGLLLGVGLGGFVDGILLHQILQWHHMLTSSATANIPIGDYPATTVHGLQMNTLWDGLFHTVTWLAVLAGLGILYSRVTRARGRVWRSRELWGLDHRRLGRIQRRRGRHRPSHPRHPPRHQR